MRTIQFFITTLSIFLLTPTLISAQNTVDHPDQDLLGLTENRSSEALLLSNVIEEWLHINEEVGNVLRIDLLSNKLILEDTERMELFDLQTAELQAELKEYLNQRMEYPLDMKDYQIEGTVIIECAFNNEGKLILPRINKGLHPSCDRAALRALEGFQYERATYSGAKRILIPLAFILE